MKPLWEPTAEQIESANMTRFMKHIQKTYDVSFADYDALYQWSIDHPKEFWKEVWEFCGIVGDMDEKTIALLPKIFAINTFFSKSKLNYAENLLKRSGPEDAIVFWGENQVKRRISFDQLRQEVAQVASALKQQGVQKGDRVAGYLPNLPETVIAMLATTSLGAIWSSCSPDFGVQGVLDRLAQIEPKVLFTTIDYYFKGKVIDTQSKVKEIVGNLPSVQKTVIIDYAGTPNTQIPNSIGYKEFIHNHSQELTFERVSFQHPLFIMYSSGTTGTPKCIVHGHGGTLIQHLKEHQLHCNIKADDRVFYFTTCGWMMWNWLVSSLASQATLVLYDGNPLFPSWRALFDLAEQERVTFFGISAKYIDTLRKEDAHPKDTHDLSYLRTIASTGSPLMAEGFDYVYEEIAPHVNLASISGGTDIISCFALGNPIRPVWRGELQTRGLGMRVEVYDDEGHSIKEQKGELVCTAPFPSMPVMFWNDPSDLKYHNAYFDRFENVWCHGDYVELTAHNGMIIYGRSDATLNPGGVRIGTAEIYRQVEQIGDVLDSIVVGQEWQGDTRIILFIKLRDGLELTDELKQKINTQIRTNASPRHVPDLILSVADIPHTVSGKITEQAVTDIIHERPVKNKEALANPEALENFKDLPELRV
jgi:acetoacetyl-CoA synthetase